MIWQTADGNFDRRFIGLVIIIAVIISVLGLYTYHLAYHVDDIEEIISNFEKNKISITQYPKINFSNYKNIRKRLIPIRMRKIIENPIYKYLKYFSLLMQRST